MNVINFWQEDAFLSKGVTVGEIASAIRVLSQDIKVVCAQEILITNSTEDHDNPSIDHLIDRRGFEGSGADRDKLTRLLNKCQDVFVKDDCDVGFTDRVTHTVKVTEYLPSNIRTDVSYPPFMLRSKKTHRNC